MLLVSSAGLIYAYQWWLSKQPVENFAYVYIETPENSSITDSDNTHTVIDKPEPLKLIFTQEPVTRFYDWTSTVPVAPLNNISHDIKQGVTVEPNITGKWHWVAADKLTFMPTKPWPAGAHYKVQIAKTALIKQITLPHYQYSFQTPPLELTISDAEFNINLKNPSKKQLVATIESNYAITKQVLAQHLQLYWERDVPVSAQRMIPYTIKLSQSHRRAYLIADNIKLTSEPQFAILRITPGVKAHSGGKATSEAIQETIKVPSSNDYLKINSLNMNYSVNDQGAIQRIISFHTNVGVTNTDLTHYVKLYLLSAQASQRIMAQASNHTMVTARMLQQAQVLPIKPLPTLTTYATKHNLALDVPSRRVIYVQVKAGLPALGGFQLGYDYQQLLTTQRLPAALRFMHKGSIIALNSRQKVRLMSRGLSAVKVTVNRILPNQLNQLLSQTYGNIRNPTFFNSDTFNINNISQSKTTYKTFTKVNSDKPHYFTLDLASLRQKVSTSSAALGLYFVTVNGWDPATKQEVGDSLKRLFLITNFGIYTKQSADESQDVFVQSIVTGKPVANARVAIIGLNGLELMHGTTDKRGHVYFTGAKIRQFTQTQKPLAFVISKGHDTSFLPFNRHDRQLNFSRYAIEGQLIEPQQLEKLTGYLFTDRGLYRPEEFINFGIIVKPNLWWQSTALLQNLANLPVNFVIANPQGKSIVKQVLNLNQAGFITTQWQSKKTDLTGLYTATLTIGKGDKAYQIATETFQIENFKPATLAMTAAFNQQAKQGWVSAKALQATIQLNNLYGLPASGNMVHANLTLIPGHIHLPHYPEYRFIDPLIDKQAKLKTLEHKLTPQLTDNDGKVVFNIDLKHYAQTTYQMNLYLVADKKTGEYGVDTVKTLMISPLPYLIGVKAPENSEAIPQKSNSKIKFIAVNSQGNSIAVDNLTVVLSQLNPIAVLEEQPNGTYHYVTKLRKQQLSSKAFVIGAHGTEFTLPTQQSGHYVVELVNAKHQIMARQHYKVLGAAVAQARITGKLSIDLNKKIYAPGETIKVAINTPYPGSGLITVERDHVAVFKWFHTDSHYTVQEIQLPQEFSGNGYIQVDFARTYNADTEQTFMNPLSYSVVPFSVDHQQRQVTINLAVPQVQLSGTELPVTYSTKTPSDIIIFAVDKGILKVANYIVPNPLRYFMAKKALQVLTLQNLDLILPRYQTHSLSTPGGDQARQLTKYQVNPFQHEVNKPMVYWSGLLTADTMPKTLHIPIPDYFNGDLQVMAVAVNQQQMGTSMRHTKVRNHFILSPSVSNVVAPGDQFTLAMTVTNNLAQDKINKPITLRLLTDSHITVVGAANQVVRLAPGESSTVTFILKAQEQLGQAVINVIATNGTQQSQRRVGISVRPARAYRMRLAEGYLHATKTLPVNNAWYSAYHQLTLSAADNPTILVPGLIHLLKQYHLGLDELYQPSPNVKQLTALLTQWQQTDGEFDLTNNNVYSTEKISLAIMSRLTQLKEQGITVPETIFTHGLNYIKQLAYDTDITTYTVLPQAQAILLLTRNGIVTTNAIEHVQRFITQAHPTSWQQTQVGLYLAAAYHLLKNDDMANAIIKHYADKSPPLTVDALAILADYFPHRLQEIIKPKQILQLVRDTRQHQTDLSEMLALIDALRAYSNSITNFSSQPISVYAVKSRSSLLLKKDHSLARVAIPLDAKAVRLQNNNKGSGFYYQLISAGYPNTILKKDVKQGLTLAYTLTDEMGKPVQQATLGQIIHVTIRIRMLRSQQDESAHGTIAITNLLPAGVSVIQSSLPDPENGYVSISDDRVIIYFGLTDDEVKTIEYDVRADTQGQFIVPGVYAQSLADTHQYAETQASHLTIIGLTKNDVMTEQNKRTTG
ncbi:MAG: alpha-2-macroglobulin [Gammaproteobacteria bacterium]